MNIKKIILAFAASAMLAGGCTSLDMDPVSDITDLNYWKTPEQFDSFVFGLHSRFRSHSWNMFLLGEARSDVFGGIPFGGEATQGMERFPEYAVHLRPEQFEETVGFVRRHFFDRHHHQPQRNFDIGRLDIEFEQFVGVMPVIQITVFTDSV